VSGLELVASGSMRKAFKRIVDEFAG